MFRLGQSPLLFQLFSDMGEFVLFERGRMFDTTLVSTILVKKHSIHSLMDMPWIFVAVQAGLRRHVYFSRRPVTV
jgi:hypothetical protein